MGLLSFLKPLAKPLIGLAGDLFQSHSNKRNQEKSIARNEAREDSKIQRTVEQAKAAGLHPLAALGASPSYSSPSVVDTTGSAIGDGIARTIQARQNKPQENLQRELMKAQLDEVQSRTQFSKAQTLRILDPQAEVPVISAWAWLQKRDGSKVPFPNPEANEMSMSEALASQIMNYGSTLYENMGIHDGRNSRTTAIDKAFEALYGRKMKYDRKDKTNYSTSTKDKTYSKSKLKPYPTKKWQP